MNRLLVFLFSLVLAGTALAQTANLYTKPDSSAPGGISGSVDKELTHAIALSRDRVHCYKADLTNGGKSFRFTGLPTGKYDLMLVAKAGAVYENLTLGAKAAELTDKQKENVARRLDKADSFFNKWKLHRVGIEEDGEKLVCFIERMRDKEILKQSGEKLGANLRRFEVATLNKATDDWDFADTRHLYREEQPLGTLTPLKHERVEALGNVRVIDAVKDLGSIALP
jgi:hypothetical protein